MLAATGGAAVLVRVVVRGRFPSGVKRELSTRCINLQGINFVLPSPSLSALSC